MKKTARIIYLIIGAGFTIFIGLLHTYAHFTDLVTPEVQEHLDKTLIIMGNEETYYSAWGVMSVMMGTAFVVIGLLNLTIFQMMKKEDYPPIFALVSMLFYLVCVIYVGHTFDAAEQFYGGLFGLVMTTIAIFLTLRGKS